LKILINKYYW